MTGANSIAWQVHQAIPTKQEHYLKLFESYINADFWSYPYYRDNIVQVLQQKRG